MSMRRNELTDECRDKLVRKVEATLRQIKRDDELLQEWDFVLGAMAAFQATFAAEGETRIIICPPRWVLNPIRGRSILSR